MIGAPTMPIGSPLSDATRSRLADWLEALSLTRRSSGAARAELLGLRDFEGGRLIPGWFQDIAAEAAAELLGGESISFGWPRPDGATFLPALRNASARLGMGAPLTEAPLWSSGREKDAGVDIIAWRGFADGRPGKLVLFGQVATGRNWPKKSVKADMPRFLRWFSERPTEHYVPAIFIPFPQHHDCAGVRGVAFDSVAADMAWTLEQNLGLVIDRMRIVDAAAPRLAARGRSYIFGKLYVWIQLVLIDCGATWPKRIDAPASVRHFPPPS